MSHSNTKELDVYVPPLPHFPDVATAKVAAEKENSPIGINHYHTTFLLLIQTSFVIVWALFMEADARKQPKPDPGDLENPARIDYVQPFKRYPPGHDIFSGSERMNEFKIQEHYSSFVQITMFTFLALPWSFSFLKRYAYSAVGFALVSASITTQFGIISIAAMDGHSDPPTRRRQMPQELPVLMSTASKGGRTVVHAREPRAEGHRAVSASSGPRRFRLSPP